MTQDDVVALGSGNQSEDFIEIACLKQENQKLQLEIQRLKSENAHLRTLAERLQVRDTSSIFGSHNYKTNAHVFETESFEAN